ncbi:hypothetical protein ACQW02_12280 [Humitalea sp. 24SJ18S-53]|uniref:hypothetical protein n=1 Tax=Humitalea sp. 24SJ18S-53 TaxID=3422307 RepID=UPI003D66C08B
MRWPALLLPILLAGAGSAGAVGLSVGHEVLPAGTAQSACLDSAAEAFASQGLRQLNRDARAVFAENRESNQVFSIYCVADRGVVTVIGAADRFEQVASVVTALRTALRTGGNAPIRK